MGQCFSNKYDNLKTQLCEEDVYITGNFDIRNMTRDDIIDNLDKLRKNQQYLDNLRLLFFDK